MGVSATSKICSLRSVVNIWLSIMLSSHVFIYPKYCIIKNDDNKNLIFKNTVSFRECVWVGSQPSPRKSKLTFQTQNPEGPQELPSSQRPAVAPTDCTALTWTMFSARLW